MTSPILARTPDRPRRPAQALRGGGMAGSSSRRRGAHHLDGGPGTGKRSSVRYDLHDAIEREFKDGGCWSAGFDLSPTTLRLIRAGCIRATIDPQPYLQGFCPVVGLTQYLRHGITPPTVDAGATIIDSSNVGHVMDLTARHYR